MTAVVMIGLNLAVLIGMGIFFHRRIENRMKPDQLIRQLRDEVNGVIADLNQATDRNVSLIEDRLETLNKMLAKADRAVRVLQREAGRGGETAWRYNDIVGKAPGFRPPADTTGAPAGTNAPAGTDAGTTAGASAGTGAGTGAYAGADGDAQAPHEGTSDGSGNTGGWARRDEYPHTGQGSDADANAGGANAGGANYRGVANHPNGASSADSAPSTGSTGRNLSKKERILDLHRKGIAPNIIAGRVGSTVGEVELVISLSEGM